MHVRHIARHEFEAAEAIKLIAFGRKQVTAPNDADDPDAIFQSVIVCCDDDDNITARARNIDYRCMFDGHEVLMTGLSGVASLPEARGLGRVRAIVSFLFAEDRARGVLLGTQFPFSHAYYRRFGYEIASERQVVRIPTPALSPFSSLPFFVKMHRLSDGFEDLRAVSTRMSARFNLGMRLTDRQFAKVCGGDPLVFGDYRYVLCDTDGTPCAYLYYTDRDQGSGNITARVEILEYVDQKALLCALGFLYGLRARYTHVELPLPTTERLQRHLPEPADATTELAPYGMARILNVAGTLEKMRHPGGRGSYALCVRDEMIPDNDGVYTISYRDAVASVSKTPKAAPDLICDIGTLTQLVLGYCALDEITTKTGVTITNNDATLRSVFVRKPTFLSFHF